MKQPKKKVGFSFLYPLSLLIYRVLKRLPWWTDQGIEQSLSKITPMKKEGLRREVKAFRCRQIAYGVGILLGAMLLWAVLFSRNRLDFGSETLVLPRNDYGESASEEQLYVSLDGQEPKEITIEVEARRYTEQELEKEFQKAFDYVESHMQGENPSLDQVWKPLELPETVPDSCVEIRWKSNRYDRVRSNGNVYSEGITEPEVVILTGIYTIQEVEKEKQYAVCVVAPQWTKEEAALEKVVEQLKQQEMESREEESLSLVTKLGNATVSDEKKEKEPYGWVLLLGLIMSILVFLKQGEALKEQVKQREGKLEIGYPELVRQLGLLIGSGTTMKQAFQILGSKYEKTLAKGRQPQPVYEEILVLKHQMAQGISLSKAVEDWGNRIGLLSYRKLANLLSQNLSRGNAGLAPLLEQEELTALEHRRQRARKMGEEAGTKLLLPMGVLLVVTIALIMVPALIQFQF